MARYIDADETTRVIERVLKKYGLDRESVVTDEMHDAIDNIPTAFDLDNVVDSVRVTCYQMGFDESQIEIIVDGIRNGGKE